MANMSYCRFRNTAGDLEDCLQAIADCDELSASEARSGLWMFQSFLRFCADWDIIAGYDGERLKEIFEDLKEKEEEDE